MEIVKNCKPYLASTWPLVNADKGESLNWQSTRVNTFKLRNENVVPPNQFRSKMISISTRCAVSTGDGEVGPCRRCNICRVAVFLFSGPALCRRKEMTGVRHDPVEPEN